MRWMLVAIALASCGRIGFDGQPAPAMTDAAEPLVWQETTPLPSPRAQPCAFGFDGRIYAAGGAAGGAPIADVLVSDVGAHGELLGWRVLASLPAPTTWHACATDPATRSAYVLGGDTGTAGRTTVYRGTIAVDGTISGWTSELALPGPRRGLGAVAVAGVLYAIGGESADGFNPQSTVYASTIGATGTLAPWTTATPLAMVDYVFGTSEIDGIVYLTGGYTEPVAVRGGVPGGALSSTASLPAPRQRHAATAAGGYVYVMGGETTYQGAKLATALRAHTDGIGGLSAWDALPDLPIANSYAAAATVDGRVYVVGGLSDSGPVANVWVLSPP